VIRIPRMDAKLVHSLPTTFRILNLEVNLRVDQTHPVPDLQTRLTRILRVINLLVSLNGTSTPAL
jgi:hypothetical protein